MPTHTDAFGAMGLAFAVLFARRRARA